MIQLNNERYWLLAAVDPETNEFLHIRLHPACTIVLTERFLRDLREKHDVTDALFLVDGAPWLQAALHRYNLRFQHVTHGNRTAVEQSTGIQGIDFTFLILAGIVGVMLVPERFAAIEHPAALSPDL